MLRYAVVSENRPSIVFEFQLLLDLRKAHERNLIPFLPLAVYVAAQIV